jgi:hypothetical protein
VGLVAVVLLSLGARGETRLDSAPAAGAEARQVAAAARHDGPAAFDPPLGFRLAALTPSGVAVFDPDTGELAEMELGPVASYGTRPALATVGPARVAVLFSDGSVGVVDLDTRTVTRIAGDVDGVQAASQPGRLWLRRLVEPGRWQLTQVDAGGAALTVPFAHAGAEPPQVVAGRLVTRSQEGDPWLLTTPDGRFSVELHTRRATLSGVDVRIEQLATGRLTELTGLAHRPVLTPDGRWLLAGDPDGNRLSRIELASGEVDTLEVAHVSGVSLDWSSLVVLPTGP